MNGLDVEQLAPLECGELDQEAAADHLAAGTDRFMQLYRASRQGGLPGRLPVPYGEFGSMAPDGKTLAYLPQSRDFRTWKRYRGGRVSEIWLFDLEDHTASVFAESGANDGQPMWHGSEVYFLSDRGESLGLGFGNDGPLAVEIPPHETRAVCTHWTPPQGGHFCVQVELQILGEIEYAPQFSQRNLDVAELFDVDQKAVAGVKFRAIAKLSGAAKPRLSGASC